MSMSHVIEPHSEPFCIKNTPYRNFTLLNFRIHCSYQMSLKVNYQNWGNLLLPNSKSQKYYLDKLKIFIKNIGIIGTVQLKFRPIMATRTQSARELNLINLASFIVKTKKSYQLAVRWKRFISSKENVDGDQILQIGREFDSENARAATRSGRFPRTHVDPLVDL